jgi:hypothetical protein
MPAAEVAGFPGHLDLTPGLGTVELGDRSYLVYPHDRHAGLADAGGVVVCLVARDRSTALRATLNRLADPSLPAHRLVILDGGSDDWSLSDAIAHAAGHGNAIVYQAPRAATLGALYQDALGAIGDATVILVPLHPDLAAAALGAFANTLDEDGEVRAAIGGEQQRIVHGDEATAASMRAATSAATPLMAFRGPAPRTSSLALCTTSGGVALALCGVLQRGPCAVAQLPSITGWPVEAISATEVERALESIARPWSAAVRAAAAALGAEGPAEAAIVRVEHPSGWFDEDTRALAAALDRAGIHVGDEDTAPESAAWTIRFAPSARAGGDTRIALRLASGEPSPTDALVADARAADAVLVASESHADACRAAGVPDSSLTVVPPVVDTTIFRPGIPPLRLGQDGSFTFLIVTPWEPQAGWDAAVAAYVRAFDARDRVSLAIVVLGPGTPSEHDASIAVLEVIAAARPGAEDDVPDISLHTTPTALEHLPSIYAGADCLVSARTAQGDRATLEAMASGLPVLAPLRPVLAGVLDGSCGFPLSRSWDEAELERALQLAASDRAGTAARGDEARRRAVRTWSGVQAAAAVARALGLTPPGARPA